MAADDRAASREVMNMAELYHRDGTVCVDGWWCGNRTHTSVPPACGVVSAARILAAGTTAACGRRKGHPGPHRHVASGLEY